MENEITENITNTLNTNTEANTSGENTTSEERNKALANDEIALAYDYYDQYYQQVLNNMDAMLINQSTTLENQEKILEDNKQFNLLIGTILFFLGIYFMYNLFRNMIRSRSW